MPFDDRRRRDQDRRKRDDDRRRRDQDRRKRDDDRRQRDDDDRRRRKNREDDERRRDRAHRQGAAHAWGGPPVYPGTFIAGQPHGQTPAMGPATTDSPYDPYAPPSDRNSGSRTGLMVIGIIMILIGLAVAVNGVSTLGGHCPMGDPSNPSSFDDSFACNEARSSGGFGMVLGFALAGFGAMVIWASQIRRVSRYMAEETAPAVTTSSTAYGTGLARGFNAGGGIPIGPPASAQRPIEREVVRIKCRSCGFLETEDARFCSNCGQAP